MQQLAVVAHVSQCFFKRCLYDYKSGHFVHPLELAIETPQVLRQRVDRVLGAFAFNDDFRLQPLHSIVPRGYVAALDVKADPRVLFADRPKIPRVFFSQV